MDSIIHPGRTKWETMLKLQLVEMIAAFAGAGMLVAANELQMPWEDRLSMLCGVGGILGAAFAVCVSTPKTHREAMVIFIGNAIAAYAWGPVVVQGICDSNGWSLTGRAAMGMSATIGATATTALKPFIAALWVKFAAWFMSLSMGQLIARVFNLKFQAEDKASVHAEDEKHDGPSDG